MSKSESEENNSEIEKSKNKLKFTLLKIKHVRKLKESEIIDYVQWLTNAYQRQGKKLKKYKEKLSKLLNKKEDSYKEASVNTPAPATPSISGTSAENIQAKCAKEKTGSDNEEEASAKAAFSFVDEMRQVAEQAQNLNDFVYEPTSGLYYDQKSGYYYNAEYGLYYDGNTGCYYRYNQEKNSHEFHSQVQVQPNQTSATATTTAKASIVGKAIKDPHRHLQLHQSYDAAGIGAAGAPNSDSDDVIDEVAFDEFGGVITDKQKLREIRVEKERHREQKLLRRKRGKTNNQELPKKSRKEKIPKKRSKSEKKSKKRSRSEGKDGDECVDGDAINNSMEDGELSSSSSDSSKSGSSESGSGIDSDSGHSQEGNDVPEFKHSSRFQDIARKYPPSLRIIVQESNLEELKVGSLSLITFKGGSLGREGNHDVIIPDLNVSKYHLKFDYDTKKAIYKCIDLGSRNGTILNGQRMASSKTESDPHDLMHGSVLQIGQTKLLCHVHEGNSTCGLCEPGLLIENSKEAPVSSMPVVLSHKEQLKKLQKKYGLENEKFVEGKGKAPANYNDRAATRRVKVGSSNDGEKTQVTTVNTEISSENKGFKMLSKLGWSKGDTLGRTNASSGLLEPINVSSNDSRKGLGSEHPSSMGLRPQVKGDKRKLENLKKTQARYNQAVTDMFGDDEENN